MPSPKELAKALARQDSVTQQPRNRFLGAIADAAGYVSDQADRYVVPERDPLFGGMRGGDLLPLRNVNRLLDDLSYGGRITTGRGQTAALRPEVVDLAGVTGAMMPVSKGLGKAALREGARQIETGTGVLGSKVMNPKMSVVPEGITSRQVRELIDKNSPGESLDFDALRSAIGGNSYKLTDYDIGKINFGDLSVDASKAMPSKGPIVIGKDGKIIDGRHRAALSKSMGDTHIKAYVPVGDNVGGAMMQRPKTEFEILHDTAQRNAALPVEQGGLGLPKGNTAMDRAGVMGFDTDTPYYHGTDYDFDKFNTAGKQKTAGAGAFLTNNPVVAETYVGGVGSGGNIMPLLARKENLLEVNAKGRNWSDINTNDLAHKRKKLSNIFPNDISPNDSTTTDQIAALAPYADFSGALIKNIRDSGPSSHVFRSKEYLQDKYGIPNTGSDTYWNDVTGDQFAEARNATDKLYSKQRGDVLSLQNPQDIRSRFAAFDPFRRHEADILAGVGVGGMLDPQAIAEALRQQDRK